MEMNNMILMIKQLGLYRNKVQPASLPPVSVKKAKHYTYNHAKFMLTSVLTAKIKNTQHSIHREYDCSEKKNYDCATLLHQCLHNKNVTL